MKIAVTGATGYIGNHLVSVLGREHEVYAIVRDTSDTAAIEPHIKELAVYDRERIYDLLAEARPDILIHLAGVFYGEHNAENISDLLESNLVFSTVIFDAAAAAGCRKIINTGTYWQQFLGEPYNPVNLYAATKQAAEDILETPGIGRKIELEKGSKILYSYKTIGISYRADNVYNCLQK